jgi:hypothetical protein
VAVNVGVRDAVRVGMIKVLVGVKVALLVFVAVNCGVKVVGVESTKVAVGDKKRFGRVTVGVILALTFTPLLIQIVINPSR